MATNLMLISLGFIGALLISLLIMPYVWRHASRATARRLQFAAPDSVVEVQADRDQLRAEHALTARKLELEIRELKERLAGDAVEFTAKDASIEQLTFELEEKKTAIAARDTEISELRASMSPMETELASRSSTVQQLRDTVRQLEERAREQEFIIKQTSEAAGLAPGDIEALRASMREERRKGPPLPMEMEEIHEAAESWLNEFCLQAEALEAHRKKLVRRRQSILKLKEKLASSTTISAREAKNYQNRIAELDTEQAQLTASLETARRSAGSLRSEIDQLDTTWQQKINPYLEMRERTDAALATIEQSSADLSKETNLRSMLAAIPGGRQEPESNVLTFTSDVRLDDLGTADDILDSVIPAAEIEEPAGEESVGNGAEETPAAEVELKAVPATPVLPKIAEAPEPALSKKAARAARVTSLAQRIRALQDEMK